jgi:regulator of cell morphogenesis and NO signaling
MINLLNETVGSLVAQDYKASAVFAKYKIDFCCKGGHTLADACETKQLDVQAVQKELASVMEQGQNDGLQFNTWPLDLLVDYIEKKHHRYVAEKIPLLQAWLEKLCRVHGGRHPELFEIHSTFEASANDLRSHMQKEEMILFPMIRRMVRSKLDGQPQQNPPFFTVKNPIAMMHQEHDTEGERFRLIEQLTNNYTPPADACTTYRVAFATLKEFETDLHTHIHLENNILFPKAIELEKELA